MHIPAPISKSGLFFAPARPEVKYPGTLTISNGGAADLVITSTEVAFSSYDEFEIGRLIGEVEGGYVTLDGCSYRTMSLPIGAREKSHITARMVFDGVGFTEAPRFSSLRFCVDGLYEWLGESAFQIGHEKSSRRTIITVKQPEEIRCTLPDGTSFVIAIGVSLPGSVRTPVVALRQEPYIALKPLEPQPIAFFQGLSHRLTRFFSFAIGKTVAIHSLEAEFEDDELPDFQRKAKVYFRSLHGTEKVQFSSHEMLLNYQSLSARFEPLLMAWLKDYDNLIPALHHHYSVQDGSHRYADTRFLAIAQALEAFHRRAFSTQKWPKAEYKNKVQAILATCPESERDWLKQKLAHGNEVSLAERLHQLIDRFGLVFGNSDAIHRIVRSTVDTRNYHAHYDRHGQSKALKGAPLVALTYQLRVLFALSLLVHLGYTEDSAVEIAKVGNLKRMLQIAEKIHPLAANPQH